MMTKTLSWNGTNNFLLIFYMYVHRTFSYNYP